MIECKGNMWEAFDESDGFFITTNSYINKKGELVMGRGIAKEAKERFPDLPKRFGKQIPHNSTYYLSYPEICDAEPEQRGEFFRVERTTKVVAFQVKHHYKEQAEISLIRGATKRLNLLADMMPELRFDLNYPGIGYGGLNPEAVYEEIKILPDNVNVWRL